MREIKARAWDGNSIRYDVTGFEHGEKNEMAGVFLDGDYHKIVGKIDIQDKTRQAVVYLYAGRKDKNGTDIYEGDRLICSEGHEWEVSFSEHGCFVAHDPQNKLEFVFLDDYDFEIIGNIHSNHELLEK